MALKSRTTGANCHLYTRQVHDNVSVSLLPSMSLIATVLLYLVSTVLVLQATVIFNLTWKQFHQTSRGNLDGTATSMQLLEPWL
jgi:hypothetical protein